MSFIDWFHWVSVVLLWACIIWNVRIARRRTRLLREWEDEAKHAFFVHAANATGLTPIQIQIAMDASLAAFHQRIEELQRSTYGRD